jgi:hypothetical protein
MRGAYRWMIQVNILNSKAKKYMGLNISTGEHKFPNGGLLGSKSIQMNLVNL